MKTWKQVENLIERNRLPYRVESDALITLGGRAVAHSVQGAHDVLAAPGHPDSKRQARRKARDLARHGSRTFKTSEVVFTSLLEREEAHLRARFLTSKLLGKRFMCPEHGDKRFSLCLACHETINPPAIPSDAFQALERKLQEQKTTMRDYRHAL
jgi:hypothetical protein